MKIIKNIIFEMAIVIGVIIWSLLAKDAGTAEMFVLCDKGIGATIMCFGILWTIGFFIRLYPSMTEKLISLSISLGLIVFGVSLDLWGLFYAICILGGYMLFLAYITGGIEPNAAKVFWVFGIVLILIGFPLRNLSKPTNVPDSEWNRSLSTAEAERSPILKECSNPNK